jgi:predicted transcriptional regulator
LAFILAPNRSSSEKLSELCHLREVATMLSRGAPSADMNEAEAELDDLFAPRTQSVPAVERALSILEFLARSRHGVTLANLTRHLGVPKSTCHALLLTFQRCGYVQRDKKNGRYRFGMKLYELSNMALSGTSLRDQVAPFLYKLVEETKLTAHLAVLEQNGEAVLVERRSTDSNVDRETDGPTLHGRRKGDDRIPFRAGNGPAYQQVRATPPQ